MATTKSKSTTNTTTLKKQITELTNQNSTLRNEKNAVLGRVGGLRAHILQNNITDTKEILRLLEQIISEG